MEIQVQELIDKIKKDGIETAKEEAARVKTDAEAEARQIIESAKKQADEIVTRGKQDAERSEKAGKAALEQASRNLILAFKGEIQTLLDKIVAAQVDASYSEDVLKTALPDLLKSWAAKGEDKLELILSEGNCSKLQGFFKEKLASQLKGGVELKSNRTLGNGFHISSREGSVYYDFSAESVAGQLSAYLNPVLADILKTSAKGQ
jgi:V/A-type H+-transporting ATPase subunit E